MAVDDVVTLKIVGRYQDQNIVNTTHWQIIEQASAETGVLANLITAFQGAIETAWRARHIDSYELVGYKAFNHTGVSKTPKFLASGDMGLVTGTEVPASVCRTITLYTGSAKHRRRGRLMLSGSEVAQFNIDDGAVTSAELALLGTLGQYFEAAIDSGGDTFFCCIPAAGEDPVELITDTAGRATPSLIKTRRIRQFSVG